MAGGSGSASTSIDIEGLLKEVPDSERTTLPKEMCIYHVPVNIRQVNKDAYTPQVICIGPIHHKNENQVMKELKRIYFRQFLDRLRVVEEGKPPEEWKPPVLEELVETLVKTITRCEVKIRNCYEDAAFEPRKDPKGCEVEILDCSEDDSSKLCEDQKVFWKMILWDAVFIFELFLKNREFEEDCNKDTEKYKYDCIIGKPWLRSAVERDLILLENQLPFWILDDLYGIVSKYIITCCSCLPKTDCSCRPETDKTCCSCLPKTDCCCPCITFPELTCTFFKYKNSKNKTSPEKPLHFTDLLRSFFLPKETSPEKRLHFTDPVRCCLLPKKPSTQRSSPIKLLHGATRLEQAGIKFKKPETDEYLINIRSWTEDDSIKKGELLVPTLVMDDHTESLFRNLMALEQCHYPYKTFICGYVIFLDDLVDTKEDADLLIKSDIIVNMLGETDDVAKLINKLCHGIVEVHSCYETLTEDLNKYYGSWFNNSKAYLRRNYFKNVWIGTGTVVGLIVLLVTLGSFVQSFF